MAQSSSVALGLLGTSGKRPLAARCLPEATQGVSQLTLGVHFFVLSTGRSRSNPSGPFTGLKTACAVLLFFHSSREFPEEGSCECHIYDLH